MNKPTRNNVKMVRAGSIKPPGYELDPTGGENHKYKCVYVTDQGKQITQRCTHEVWKRCEGRNLEGRARDGLCDKLHCQFLLWIDGEQFKNSPPNMDPGLITSIDILPENYYMPKQVMPELIADRSTIGLNVDQIDGHIEIVALSTKDNNNTRAIPAGVTKSMLERLIKEINKVPTLEPGDTLPGGFEVTGVNGKIVEILPPHRASV
jgi:hypothetical protein